MVSDELWTSWGDGAMVLLSGVLILAAVITTIRIVGLRSLSKMSSFDFVVTVAIGSIIASVTATSTSVENGALAVVALLGTQAVVATLRRHSSFDRIVDNTPVMLMRDGGFDLTAMNATRVTRSDVFAKLREANVLRLEQVRAVVLETTGDISVLHGDGPVDEMLLDNVKWNP